MVYSIDGLLKAKQGVQREDGSRACAHRLPGMCVCVVRTGRRSRELLQVIKKLPAGLH
jgi:hypothetical protein